MPEYVWITLTLVVALIMGFSLRHWAKANGQSVGASQGRVLGVYARVLIWLRHPKLPSVRWHSLRQARLLDVAAPYLEMAAVTLLAAYFGRSYLNLDPTVWPRGNEFTMGIQSHYIWPLFLKCGACIAWNGFTVGGVPTFVDLHGGALHPLVIASTLIWGVINGAKITLVACLALAGVAQWWLARSMGLGRVARLWAATMGVVAGHVAGRMQIGLVPLAISVAMCSLLIAACVDLALTRTRRAALRASVVLALSLVAGQGYLQIGLALSVLPALLLLLINREWQLPAVWKEFALAGGLALLLAGVLLVPLVHFWPNIDKDIDPAFAASQPAAYAPFNLVIADLEFYNNTALGKQVYGYLYTNYVGWLPVLLAMAALYLVPPADRRLLFFFLAAIGLVYLTSGAVTLRGIERLLPNSVAGIRNPSLISSLAVPLVLALSAWSVDRLVRADWPKLKLMLVGGAAAAPSFSVSLAWWLLPAVMAWSVRSAYQVNRVWLTVEPMPPAALPVTHAMAALVPDGRAQWVQPPWGEHFWLPPAMDSGLKISSYFRPWRWRAVELPPPYVEATRDSSFQSDPDFRTTVADIHLLVHRNNEYAFVESASGIVPCSATAAGGNIDVYCVTSEPGTLLVREHMLDGWSAARGGASTRLMARDWLSVEAPAGEHLYRFRYRPWDVVVGLLSTLLGVILLIRWWPREPEEADQPAAINRDVDAVATFVSTS